MAVLRATAFMIPTFLTFLILTFLLLDDVGEPREELEPPRFLLHL
jgi:hypothetical protein